MSSVVKRMESFDHEERGEFLIPPDPKEEDIFEAVKGDGPWQWRVNFFLILFCFPAVWQNLSIIFIAPNVDHWCSRPPESNMSVGEWRIDGLPPHDPKCSRYKEPKWNRHTDGASFNLSSQKEEMRCTSWEYAHTVYTSTVVEEWDLVCEHEWYISLSKSIFTLGYMFTVSTSGFLSDSYGRKPVIIISNFIGLVASFLCAFSNSFMVFAVWRFFIAMGVTAAETVAFVLCMEITTPEYRSFYGTVGGYGFAIAQLLLLLLAWCIRSWFWFQIAITAGPSVLFLCCWWLIPESPRWLLANGRVGSAMRILKKVGKANKVDMEKQEIQLEEMHLATNKSKKMEQNNANILQLFKEPRMRKQTFILYYIWFVVAFVFWSITYNTNDLAGDPFLNFASYAVIGIPSTALTQVITKAKGRKYPLMVMFVASGVACLIEYVVPEDCWWMTTSLLLAGRFFISAAFTIVYIFTVELLPTVLRNTGLGSASTVARVGNILAPFVRELGQATHPVVPQLLYGVLAVTAGFLVLLLPETNNSHMPDTLEEASEISRTHHPKSYGAWK